MAVDLRANAIISFTTRGLGSVTSAAGALNRFGSRAGTMIAGGLDRARNAASRLNSASLQAAAGIGAIVYRTQEFEKKALGARIATIADAMQRVNGRIVVDHARIAREGELIKQQALDISRAYGVQPTGLMEAAEAAAKMGISLEKAEAIMRTSAMLNMADPEQGFGQAAEFLGTLSKQFRAPEGSKEFGQWILSTGDKIATVASGTRTSISNIEEGFRQFSGVFATFGATVDQSAALVGAMSQGGLLDVESGTALKSFALRFIKPTLGGVAALSAAGFDRSKYMDLTGADPLKGTMQLMRQFGAYLGKQDKERILQMLSAAQKAGKGADPAHIDKVAGYIQKRTGGKEAYEDTYLKVLNTITTAGGEVKLFEYIADIAKAFKENRLSPAQLAEIGEGRHISRMMTLFQQWGEVERLMGLINGLGGEGLDATRVEYLISSFGKWQSAMASLDRSLIRIRESDAFSSVIATFERFSGAIASMPDGQAEKLTALAVGIAAIAGSPLAIAVAGVAALAKVMGGIGEAKAAIADAKTMPDDQLNAIVEKMTPEQRRLTPEGQEWQKRRYARGADEWPLLNRLLGIDPTGGDKPLTTATSDTMLFRSAPGIKQMPPFHAVSRNPPNLGAGSWSPPPGWIGEDAWSGATGGKKRAPWYTRSAVPYSDPGHSMVRDIVPTAGPQTIDITGRVQADATVTGSADVTVNNEITVRVEGPGTVVNQTGRGGTANVPLNTGKQAAATKAE